MKLLQNYRNYKGVGQMVKSKRFVESKMRQRVSTSGQFLRDGMNEAQDPVDKLLSDVDKYEKKLVDGVQNSIKAGSYRVGLEKAKKRNSWKNSIDKAGRHYEESADMMVDHALEDYDQRAKLIEQAQDAVRDMPTATRAQRIQKSAKYQEIIGKLFDGHYGRKTV